jgi:hypothetical protein
MKRILALCAALLWLGGANAFAANTAQVGLSEGAYTDLGLAPVSVQAINGNVYVVVADSLPALAAGGVSLNANQPNAPITFNQADASSHVYALAVLGPATIAYTLVYGTGGGGGGGGGAVTAISGAFVSGAIADLALAQNSTTAGEVGNLPLTATTTGAPTYTTAKSNPLSTDTAGNLRTNVTTSTPEGGVADAAGCGSTAGINPCLKQLHADITTAIPTQAPTVSIGGVGIVDSAGTNVATVKAASTLPVAADKTLVVGLNPGTATAGSPTGAIVTVQGVSGGQAIPISGSLTSQYPATAVPITASATGTTGATTATLTNVSGHTTYICGYSIRANATAATTVLDTVTGVITATMSSELWVAPLASGIGVDEQIFTPCIPASAVSTSIAVVSGAPGAGGLVSVKAWGYSL